MRKMEEDAGLGQGRDRKTTKATTGGDTGVDRGVGDGATRGLEESKPTECGVD